MCSSDLEMHEYLSDVGVFRMGPGACEIEWSGSFATASVLDPNAQRANLKLFYTGAVAGLRQITVGA